MKHIAAFLLVFLLLGATPANACRGVESESETFLMLMPPEAMEKSIVAKVEIQETSAGNEQPGRLSKVRVLEGMQGVNAGDTITVASQMHSCASDAQVKAGEIYFIAGEMHEGVFHGEWQGFHSRLPR